MPRWARGPRICDPSFIMKQGQPIMNRLLPLTVALAIAVLLPVTAAVMLAVTTPASALAFGISETRSK